MHRNVGETGEGEWGCLLLLAIVAVGVGAAVWSGVDRFGYMTHDHDTPVWIQGDWMVGEYRHCQMRTKTVPPKRKDLDSLDKLPRMFCGQDANGLFDFQREIDPPSHDVQAPPEGTIYLIGVTSAANEQNFHLMPVRYWGRIDRQDKWIISWQCLRKAESLECKALN